MAEVFDFHKAQKKDEVLYDQWKEDPSKKNMGKLVHQLSGPIYKEVRRLAGALPTEALAAEAKKWAIKAIKVYNPERGAAISTHVTNYVQKARRMNYEYQNSARMPENLQRQYHEFSSAVSELESVLGREPKDLEIAKKLKWSPAQVTKYRNSLYADHFESGTDRAIDVTGINNDRIRINHVIDNLSSGEKALWFHSGGAAVSKDQAKGLNVTKEEMTALTSEDKLPATDLAKKLNVNLNQLNYMKKKLRTKIQGLQKDIGYY